nr:alpha-1B-glycoprotein-like [Pelodiscus sinensis]|eukprot:XP_025038143.1 alpha-1B-glycoprotein-like [Pelodiscus sinensis]
MNKTLVQPGDSVRFQCSAFSWAWATRIVFCKDGEEVFTQRALEEKNTDNYEHVVSSGSSGNYSCGYEIKDSDHRVYRSQLSTAQHLSVTGALPAPILYINQTSAWPGDTVRLRCSVFSRPLATRIVFCKDGEEVFIHRVLEEKMSYDYDHMVSGGSSGNYSCGYEIQDSGNWMNRSQLSPAQLLSVTGALPAPILYINQTSAWPGDTVRLRCSVFSRPLATRIVFCKDGEEVFIHRVLEEKMSYDYDHMVSGGSSGNYSCGYEIQDSGNWMNRSQLSPAQLLSVTGALPAPILFLNQTLAQPGDSVQFQCSVVSQALPTHIIFCKDGEKVSSQSGSEAKVIYSYKHMVSGGSSGRYACGYEIKDNTQMTRSQLSPAQHLSVIGKGALPAPILFLNQTLAQPGDSVQFQCSVVSQALPTHIIFCKDGEKVSSQSGSEAKVIYSYKHMVSGGSSGRYACGYEIKDNTQMTRSQLSPAQHLSVIGKGLTMSPAIWATRCILVLLLLVSAPVITFVLEKRSLTRLQG